MNTLLLTAFFATTALVGLVGCGLLLRKIKKLQVTIELQQIEAELNQSSERFHGICEHSELGVLIANPEGRFTYVNNRYLKMIGATMGEVLNGQWITHLHPDDQAEIQERWNEALRTQQGFVSERRSLLGDGSVNWANVHTFPIRGKDDSFRGFVTTVEDITARKQAEASLRSSEERYAEVFRLLPDVLTISDLVTGRYVEVSQRWQTLIGYSRKEALGRTSVELDIWYDEAGRRSLLDALNTHGEVRDFPVCFRHKDGHLVEGEISGSTILLDGVPHLILISHDVTQRNALALARNEVDTALRESEQALRISEAKFSGAFHASLDYITISYLDTGKIFEVNEAFEAMTGWTRDEAIGRTSIELGIWPHAEERVKVVAMLLAQGSVRDYRCRIGLKSGEQRSCLLNASTIEVGGQFYLLGVVRDITAQEESQRHIEQLNESLELRVRERTAALEESNHELASTLASLKATQNELIRAEKLAALGSLVAGIAHELNTPIGNGVTVASTLFERTREFSEAIHSNAIRRSTLNDYVEIAQTASDLLLRNLGRARDLITSFKQVAIDQTSDQRRSFDLRTVIEEVIATISPMTKNTPYQIELELAEGLTLDSYPGPLGQIITNFMSNALHHAFEGLPQGCIRIATRSMPGNSVEIVFSDNGAGIAEEHMGRIFDPFFTTKLGKGGSGLGLNIVHNIATRMLGGRLTVSSQPGQGTIFTITIPVAAPAGEMEISA